MTTNKPCRARKGKPPAPKFRVGQIVVNELEGPMKITDRHFDPCDGWEYDMENEFDVRFESNLRRQTKREAGR